MPVSLSRLAVPLIALLLSWQASAADLTISAATSLTQAFKELAPLFEAQYPDTKVLLNFGASGALLQQIAKGAPVDVFASADQASMDEAQAQLLVQPAQRRNFVSNALVVIVPAGSSKAPKTLQDLATPAFARVAIGLPASVPAGRYAKALLDKAGLWASVEPKMIGAQNVRQALDYVARGEVDAGFVYATDAAAMPGKVTVAVTVPTAEVPVRYPVAPVATGPNRDAAHRFIAFLFTPSAQVVLAKHGFGKP